ncbi:hypothetical protein BZA05DRAFT_74841 [Tricharina praecox]|uniref:uncharacterized protein n=1 Tax=Tricharina praecox TaxID=43433 RepID=UPI00221EA382|nr:uncharacterized protein BZA05DRAFT_74841 [Tricharina praecox]KAI5849712.1 hypothetical protein BZA05DRAFT_74841 [Tricharina praecox]
MAAEVAASPSQAPTGGGNVGGVVSGVVGVAGLSSGPKSPFRFNSPTSSSIAHASPPQKYQTQSNSQYKSTTSPNDDASSSSSFFSHRQQRLSPSSLGSALSPAQDRSIPRGLPPMMTGTPPAVGGGAGGGGGAGAGAMDLRLPLSPGSIAMALNDNQDALSGDLTAPRKRSKVSRACDECRRKKVGSAWDSIACPLLLRQLLLSAEEQHLQFDQCAVALGLSGSLCVYRLLSG